MPIYEYRCKNCGHELETLQKVSEGPLLRCPNCDTDGLKKRVSAAGFRLKGGGWYETDFKSGKKRNVSGEKAGGENTGGSSGDGEGKKSSGDAKESTGKSSSSESSGKTSSDSSKGG